MCGEMILFYWSQVDEATRGPPELIDGKNYHLATVLNDVLPLDTNEAVYPVRFLVQGMVLFKESLSRWTTYSRRDGIPNKNSMFATFNCRDPIHLPITLALSEEFVKNAVELLITRFMPLNPTDLEQWMADPEEWVNNEDKENDLWEYEIRVRLLQEADFSLYNLLPALQRKSSYAVVQSICPGCYTIIRGNLQAGCW